MIGVDTNVLARYFAADEDHLEQTALARHIIDGTFHRGEALFVSDIVLCETVWVLLRSFKLRKEAVLKALDWILEQPLCRLEAHVAVAKAIERYRASNADFADFLIASAGSEAGCATTFTFDKAAGAIEGFSLVKES